MQRIIEYKPTSISLPKDGKLYRTFKSTKSHLAGVKRLDSSDYADYETHVVFYDIYLGEDGNRIFISAPPMLNLREALFPFEILDICDKKISKSIAIKNFQRSCFISVKINHNLDTGVKHKLKVKFKNGLAQVVEIGRLNLPPVFLQMATLQKNNPVNWIKDWIEYHEKQGTDRFLIYDNGSSDYDEIKQMLQDLRCKSELVLISWPFKYGTLRSHRNKFCPNAQRNHAVKFFSNAQWTGFFDIDEYLVLNGPESVDELLKKQSRLTGAVRCDNYIVPNQNIEANSTEELSFRDFEFRERQAKGKAHKYFLRHSAHREAKTHNAKLKLPYIKSSPQPDKIHFLHYRGLNTNWKQNSGVASSDEKSCDLVKIHPLT